MPTEKILKSSAAKTNSIKIGNLRININSSFYPAKKLDDILFSIVTSKLKEKSI